MRCDVCGEDDDVFFISGQGSSDELALCRACAAARGFSDPDGQSSPETACPSCGMVASAVLATGRLGCLRCVSVFRHELALLWRRAGRPAAYSGKVPGGKPPRPEAGGRSDGGRSDGGRSFGGRSVDELRVELAAALKDEDFERAAALRDEIRRRGDDAGVSP